VTRLRAQTPGYTQSDQVSFPDTGLHSKWLGFIIRNPVTLRVTRLHYQAQGSTQSYQAPLSDTGYIKSGKVSLPDTTLHWQWPSFLPFIGLLSEGPGFMIKYLATLSDQNSLTHWETLSDQASLWDTGLYSEWPAFVIRHWATLRVTRLHYESLGYIQSEKINY
jgi:hypothetical protein